MSNNMTLQQYTVKILAIVALLSVPAHADTLDSVVRKINNALVPKEDGKEGYTVQYRQDREAVWINIARVTLICSNVPAYVLKNGKIETGTEGCNYRIIDNKNVLYQITCFDKTAKRCKKMLADQLSVDLIKQITARNIKDVKVK